MSKIFQSEYLRNIATLVSGTTLAQGFSLITAPILYRIYDKVDYGTLGVYMGLCGVIGVFSTLQYLEPILLEKDHTDAKKMMWLNRLINLVVSITLAILILFLKNPISVLLNNPDLENWLYLIPISVFFTGQTQIFRRWANRLKEYKIMTFNTILTALLVPCVSISVGVYNNGPLGLFLGLLVSQVAPSIILAISLSRKEDLGLSFFDWDFIKLKIREHKAFPQYVLPSEFINRYTNQLPVFMLSTFTTPGTVGIYNLTVRMLGLPAQLIGGAIGEVFKQKATEDYNRTGQFREIFVKTFKNLSLFTIVPIIIILLWAPSLFAFLFGLEWRQSGEFARILVWLYMAKLIVSPLSYSFFLKKKLRQDLIWHIWMLISNTFIFYITFTFFAIDEESVLTIFSINYIIIYIIYIYNSYNFSHQNESD